MVGLLHSRDMNGHGRRCGFPVRGLEGTTSLGWEMDLDGACHDSPVEA